MRELRWYLEDFPALPYASDAERARSVLEGLRTWGERAFRSLFGNLEGRRLLDGAARDGLGRLLFQIRSDDPGVLSWPWEALHSPETGPEAGPLGQRAWVERSLEIEGELPAAPQRAERIDLLLVSPRPLPRDVPYRLISRPLLETLRGLGLAVQVHVLRPPTFEHLRAHLAERPGFYHVLHFDGHGVYAGDSLAAARRGFLYFEKAGGGSQLVPGEDLGALIRTAGVPLVVLNACQSGQVDDGAQTAFASVAAALLQGGARSVVAMAYTLTVSGAEQFVPAFYRRLFETGNVAEAVRAGRQRMAEVPSRVGARGRLDLGDWIVPVLYRREGAEVSLSALGAAAQEPGPVAARFVGRDEELLWLERGLLDPRSGQLVHGLAGVGKTTLARELVEWLRDTDGIREGAVWLDSRKARTVHDLLAPVGEALAGEALTAPQIVELLRARRLLLVWDGLESDALADEDRRQLRDLLRQLRGGAARVLLTGRGEAAWLDDEVRRLPLTGLAGEDRWRLCEEILAEQGQQADLGDPDLAALVERLEGHPLALRAVLSELPERGARALLQDLDAGQGADPGPLAALALVERSLPDDLRPLFTALSLFEEHVDARVLAHLANAAGSGLSPERIARGLEILSAAGLVARLGTHTWDLHPTVAGFLRADRTAEPAWEEAFVATQEQVAHDVMSNSKISFRPYRADFRKALEISRRQGQPSRLLLSVLAAGASELSDFGDAVALSAELADLAARDGNAFQESAAACEVGDLLRLQGDLEGAARWLRRAAEVAERAGDAVGAADAHLQLASMAWRALDHDAAERSARRSLAFSEEAGDTAWIAKACLELGLIAGLRKDFAEARRWFKRALDLRTRQGSRTGVARIHHELGIVALHEGDLDEAEAHTRRALTVYLGTGDPADIGGSYHQLGRIAEERGDLPAAEEHYRHSLLAKERAGDVREIGLTSRQLGVIAERSGDLETADLWFRRAREVLAPLADPLRYAVACDLGRVAEAQRDLTAAERWYREALGLMEAAGDTESAAKVREHLEGLFDRVAHVEGSFFYMKEMIFGESVPSPLRDRLRRLDDRSALALLARETAPLAEKEGVETEANEEVLWTLVDVFGFPDDMPSPSDADLARVALSALAEDPPVAEALDSALASPLESAGEHLPVMTGALLALQHYAEFSREKGVLRVTVIMRGGAQFAALQELTHALLLRAEEGRPGLILRLRKRAHAVLQQIRSEGL